MRLVVFLKQVPDNAQLKIDANGPVRTGAAMMTNPFDEYALETALRLKEAAGGDASVTVITLGEASAREGLKKAIAVGADAGILLRDDALNDLDPAGVAAVLAAAVKTLVPDFKLLLFGQMALDDAAGQVGPAVAALLDLPVLSFCKAAETLGENELKVTRETERSMETLALSLPAALCVMKCDYELRGSNIKGVMRANKADIPVKTASDLGLEPTALAALRATRLLRFQPRPVKTAGVMLEGKDPASSAVELVSRLRQAKVL